MRNRVICCEKLHHSSINKNLKRIENRLLLPKPNFRPSCSERTNEKTVRSQKKISETNSCNRSTSLLNKIRNEDKRKNSNSTRNWEQSGENCNFSISKTKQTTRQFAGSKPRLIINNMNTCSICLNKLNGSVSELSSRNKKIALYRLSRDSGVSCMIQDANGHYHQRTVFFIHEKGLNNQAQKDNLSSASTTEKCSNYKEDTLSSGVSPQHHQIHHASRHSKLDRVNYQLPCNYSSSPIFACSHCTEKIRANLCTNAKELNCFHTIDPQIDPTISRSHPLLGNGSGTPSRNSRIRSCFFRFFFSVRNFFFPNSVDNPEQQPIRLNFINKFLASFKSSSTSDRRSLDCASSTTTLTGNNLFCWTCIEMNGDDESLSSVDSGID